MPACPAMLLVFQFDYNACGRALQGRIHSKKGEKATFSPFGYELCKKCGQEDSHPVFGHRVSVHRRALPDRQAADPRAGVRENAEIGHSEIRRHLRRGIHEAVVREELEAAFAAGTCKPIWQYFAVVPDMRATGVENGKRRFDWPVIIRAVNTVDAMSATVPEIDWAILEKITARILAAVPGVCRVL
jgi:GMP synthase (glutamine-hydrolysing)